MLSKLGLSIVLSSISYSFSFFVSFSQRKDPESLKTVEELLLWEGEKKQTFPTPQRQKYFNLFSLSLLVMGNYNNKKKEIKRSRLVIPADAQKPPVSLSPVGIF